ncbi:MAG: KEOPS complex subunit Cgi121 [Promethearchaeota archaeon]
MIVNEFKIQDLNLHYFVGINQIKLSLNKIIETNKIKKKEEILNQFFNIIYEIQDRYENSMIQFIKDKYLLNKEHIFTACYYLEKAFLQNNNISNKKNIELLVYLATKRQINKSIEGFGIEYSDLIKNKLTFCIISPKNNLDSINTTLLSVLSAEEEEITLNLQSNSKIHEIKKFFKISNNQIDCALNSYGIVSRNSELNLKYLASAVYDLICEKMAILYVEKAKKA